MGLEFQTAAKVAVEGGEWSELMLDGVTLRYRAPEEGQLALAMAYTAGRQKQQDQLSGLIDFFFSVFDAKSQGIMQRRMFDPEDPFGLTCPGGINDILDALFEEWSGRPTRRSTGSTGSPPSTGPSLSQATPESTSSD